MLVFMFFIIIMIAVFGLVGFLTIKRIKSTDPNNINNSLKNSIETTQAFLPYEDIRDSMIDLGQHQYRAILKCNSISYNLKSDKEKLVIEATYQRFINSLLHPIAIFIQTKVMDNSKILKGLKKDIDETIVEFPMLSNYGENFYSEMTNLHSNIGNNKEKNKYIIVPYDDAINLTNCTDEEKYEYALKEIFKRCQLIIDNLQGVGVSSYILPTSELLDIVYTNNHKDNVSQIENITSGEFLSMTVNGEDKLSKISNEGKLDWILYEAQSRLETEVINNKSVSDDLKNRSMDALTELGKIREALAGEYLYTFNINKKVDFK